MIGEGELEPGARVPEKYVLRGVAHPVAGGAQGALEAVKECLRSKASPGAPREATA